MKSTFSKIIFICIAVVLTAIAIINMTYSDQSWAKNLNDYRLEYPDIHEKWQHSHHQKAMLVATKDTVLGNFHNTEIEINGIKSSFFQKNDEFWISTNDVAAPPKEFRIEYVFGFEPLQQYLVKTENGKYQVLPFSWDSRPTERGGQRWFHIYGDDHITINDRLHWTEPLQNWNGMCADCHSTALKRNNNITENSFSTTWETINVSCQSCHIEPEYDDFKITATGSGWSFEEGANTASWHGKIRQSREIEVCAACHSRRSPLTDGFIPNGRFLDHFSPTLIKVPEYYPDGQVKEEDYVWGSFLQSKMFSKGVICSDCHDPHSLELKLPGNELCGQCHLPEHFDTPEHHHHVSDSKAAQCVTCHMPESTFMQVDTRNDHSFRIPRPDLHQKTGSPDVCTSCHEDMSPATAATTIESWNNRIKIIKPQEHYGEIFSDVLSGNVNAEQKLKRLIHDAEIPAIIRASGYSLLEHYPNADTISHIERGLSSDNPLIRLGAIRATGFIPPQQKQGMLQSMLQDEFKAIRVEAYDKIGNDNIDHPSRQEFLIATRQGMWRGEGHYNLALFNQKSGNINEAIEGYMAAQKIDPYFPASYINLADIFRSQENEHSTQTILDRGLKLLPNDPDINFSKALQLVRTRKTSEALKHLEKAVRNAPENMQYAYVYGVALRDFGELAKAKTVLIKAHLKNANNPNINFLLLEIYRTEGNWKEALKYAENLSKLHPNNNNISRLIVDLNNKTGKKQ